MDIVFLILDLFYMDLPVRICVIFLFFPEMQTEMWF